MPRITPNLWFDANALDAAEFYVSVFPNSRVGAITYYPDNAPTPGGVLTVNFELDGQEHTGINGGPQFTFDEAISLLINCKDQAEVDYYWLSSPPTAARRASAVGSRTSSACRGRSCRSGGRPCSPATIPPPTNGRWMRCPA